MAGIDGTPRFHVTMIDGWPVNQREGADAPGLPGASFHVVDSRSGQLAAVYRSEDRAAGLPHDVRVRMAQLLADETAARLNHEIEAQLQP